MTLISGDYETNLAAGRDMKLNSEDIREAEAALSATGHLPQSEIDDLSNPDKGAIGEQVANLLGALESAREYVASDARNYKYPAAIETLAVIDAALRRS